ncbi:hypothetical protein HAX54_013152, partial [Datura stramonium]|nr:hypothetical protein [Datura stramonium]
VLLRSEVRPLLESPEPSFTPLIIWLFGGGGLIIISSSWASSLDLTHTTPYLHLRHYLTYETLYHPPPQNEEHLPEQLRSYGFEPWTMPYWFVARQSHRYPLCSPPPRTTREFASCSDAEASSLKVFRVGISSLAAFPGNPWFLVFLCAIVHVEKRL